MDGERYYGSAYSGEEHYANQGIHATSSMKHPNDLRVISRAVVGFALEYASCFYVSVDSKGV